MGKPREDVLRTVSEHWPDLVEPCRFCSEARKQLHAFRMAAARGENNGTWDATNLETVRIQCPSCNSHGFKLTEKGAALAELFSIGMPVEEEEEDMPI